MSTATATPPASSRITSLSRVIVEIQRLMTARVTGSIKLNLRGGKLMSVSLERHTGEADNWKLT